MESNHSKEPDLFFGLDERIWVALSSVIAAIVLTGLKLIVGIVTGSIGILSEALHSGLDLIAAAITFFAVKSSNKPADQEYHYGYGKIESLSALIETILLLLAVIWIIYEATRRIILSKLEVETNIWAFGVIIFAIIVDYSRSRVLYKAAEKYDSQALKADALHFSTDILSSSVVFIGLLFTHYGFPLGDPIGAIGVAAIVLYLTIDLGKETVDSLLDRAPKGYGKKIRSAINSVQGIKDYNMLRVRKSGPTVFVDLICKIDSSISFEESHEVAERIRYSIKEAIEAPVDVVIHVEPESGINLDLLMAIRKIAGDSTQLKDIHNIQILELENILCLTLHVEVDPNMCLGDAHNAVIKFEEIIHKKYPKITDIVIHFEPYREKRIINFHEKEEIKNRISKLVGNDPILINCSSITIFQLTQNNYNITINCEADRNYKIQEIHKATVHLEDEIKEEMPIFSEVIIHVEPKN